MGDEKKGGIAEKRYRSIISRNLSAKNDITKEEFEKWWNDSEDKCHYCGITTRMIQRLMAHGEIRTKRIGLRGLTMEVDRKDPQKGYQKENIVKCCYWCNNAKTDEFSEKEFCKIGRVMGEVWTERLKNIDEKKDLELPPIDKKPRCDWEKPNGVVFALPWGMYSVKNKEIYCAVLKGLIKEILRNMADENFKIVLVYKDVQSVVKHVKKIKKYKDDNKKGRFLKKISLLSVPHLEDIWVRDFMPIAMGSDGKHGLKAVYAPIYFENERIDGYKGCREYSWSSHVAGIEIAEALGIKMQYLSSSGSGFWYNGLDDPILEEFKGEGEIEKVQPIILDGGNLVHNGKVGFVSARVITENIDEKFKDKETDLEEVAAFENDSRGKTLLETIKKRTGLEEIYILPVERTDKNKSEVTGHLDGTLRFPTKDLLLIDKNYRERLQQSDHYKKIFETLEKEKITILSVKQHYEKSNEVSAFGITLNYLQLGDILFVPKFHRDKDKDKQDEKTEEKSFDADVRKELRNRELKIIPVEENGSISDAGGVFNCISWVF